MGSFSNNLSTSDAHSSSSSGGGGVSGVYDAGKAPCDFEASRVVRRLQRVRVRRIRKRVEKKKLSVVLHNE
jgi:hypothetical protein